MPTGNMGWSVPEPPYPERREPVNSGCVRLVAGIIGYQRIVVDITEGIMRDPFCGMRAQRYALAVSAATVVAASVLARCSSAEFTVKRSACAEGCVSFPGGCAVRVGRWSP